ncbi:MAG: TonB-dependent receptor family protein [Rikenellaceae bacterium]|nr:TonB-dependent receptor family protein [Rikenellaceae bacterium]
MMKGRFTAVVVTLLFWAAAGVTAAPVKVRGKVTDGESGSPVGFSTVVALAPDSTVAGAVVAGEDGRYSIELGQGRYIFNINCIGFEPFAYEITCADGDMVLDFELAPSAVAVEEVSVRAARVRRESDRYIISVAGSKEAIGKNAEEFLNSAPSVWIRNDRIMVEGRSGAKVMVNDRLLNMDDEQVLAYLRNINADDIARVEIIPRAGADLDASATGGVIKITLKRRRDDGIEISPSMRAQWAKDYYRYRPGLSVNYRIGSLSTYMQAFTDHDDHTMRITEQNTSAGTELRSQSVNRMKEPAGGGRLGAIYDIGERQTVGAEYSTYISNDLRTSSPSAVIFAPDPVSSDSSAYRDERRYRNHYVAANYILRLDSLGSLFKVVGDLAHTSNPANNTYRNRHTLLGGPGQGTAADTLYRNDTQDKYLVATGTLALEKVFADGARLQAGMKYIYTTLDDDSRYYGARAADWELNTDYSIRQKYTENIAAAYVSYSSNLGILSYNLGLRGEYTRSVPTTTLYDGSGPQRGTNNYFSLFPNVNLSLPFHAEKGYSVAAFYTRKISRPGYWALNPNRMQLSEYSYLIGDPALKPAYTDETGLRFLLADEYTFTASYQARRNVVHQFAYTDPQRPEVIVYRQMNIGSFDGFTLSANVPVEITDKIDLDLDLYFNHVKMDPGSAGRTVTANNFSVNGELDFALPRSWRLELEGHYDSGELFGNLRMKGYGDADIAVRKRFLDDKVSVAAEVRNVFGFSSTQTFKIDEDNFSRRVTQNQAWSRRMVVLNVQYNFKAGRKANGRSVERGGDDSR